MAKKKVLIHFTGKGHGKVFLGHPNCPVLPPLLKIHSIVKLEPFFDTDVFGGVKQDDVPFPFHFSH